mmetsp:Transcript_8711/g.19789  ORF Transcript_8711/g.19789 Transcript_8711/m.19789 type:complete len:265 (-) Transcript_8711:1336-2130(-)
MNFRTNFFYYNLISHYTLSSDQIISAISSNARSLSFCPRSEASMRSFSSAIRSIDSSTVPTVTRRITSTSRNWPRRCARSSACRSIMGLTSRSNSTTALAPVRLMPCPPARVLSRNAKREESGSLNSSTSRWRSTCFVEPSRRQYLRCCMPIPLLGVFALPFNLMGDDAHGVPAVPVDGRRRLHLTSIRGVSLTTLTLLWRRCRSVLCGAAPALSSIAGAGAAADSGDARACADNSGVGPNNLFKDFASQFCATRNAHSSMSST